MFSKAIKLYLEKTGFEKFQPKAVLFDMDGVLFDSMPHHAKSWAQVSGEFGLHMTQEDVYMNEGRTGFATINLLAEKYWKRRATPEEIEKIYEGKCKLFNSYPKAAKMTGADEVIAKAETAGLQVLVVTGSGQASLLNRLETNFPGHFPVEHVVSSKDVKYGKPNPEPYLMGLEKAGVKPWEAIVVENAPLGVRAGVAADIFTVAVNTGPLADQILLDEGANLLFPSMSDFAEHIEDLINHK